MARHVKKGDTVMVIAGRDYKNAKKQGTVASGRILRVFPDKDQVIVEGVNIHKRHMRASQQHPQGGVIEKEMPIHISNVQQLVDGKPTRVRFEKHDDGSKIRIAVKTGEQIGEPLRKAKKQ